ncbi:lipopolysaccharide-induced tumor necrosis factor-alpha factor-like, partial [Silurus meridionalis]
LIVAIQAPMKSLPAATFCRFCQQQVVTVTKPINGVLTWIVVGTLFFCLIWPFCLIPFCVSSCKDIKHTCPRCNNVLHTYKRV